MYDLGLTSEAVWKLTPAQYTALLKRVKGEALRDDFRFGIVGSVVAHSMGAKIRPEDMFSSIRKAVDQVEAERAKNTTAAQMLAFVVTANQQLGGKDLRPEHWEFNE